MSSLGLRTRVPGWFPNIKKQWFSKGRESGKGRKYRQGGISERGKGQCIYRSEKGWRWRLYSFTVRGQALQSDNLESNLLILTKPQFPHLPIGQ